MTEQDEPDGGRTLPPYEGRKKSADVGPVDEGQQDGVAVGGARRPIEADGELRRPEPEQTPGGAVASPAEERSAAETAEASEADRDDAVPEEASTGPAHQAGVPRGEAQ